MAKEIETLYNEHFEERTGANNLYEYSEADVDRVLCRLLKCLPNDGKFYKYRKGEGEYFDNAYDSLKNGYLWLAQATTLNDDVDTTINFDPEKDIEDVKQYILSYPKGFYIYNLKKAEELGDLDVSQNGLFLDFRALCFRLGVFASSQKELAKLLDVSLASVIRWENGHNEPTIIAKIKLEQLFKENNIYLEDE